MSSDDSTKRMISRALVIVEEARFLQEKQAWNMVVRRSQEAVELALKAALLWARIEVPRIHDVGPLLRGNMPTAIHSPFRGAYLIWLPSLAC